MIAIFISLDESHVQNGGLCIYPGSHLLGPQDDIGKDNGTGHHYLNQNHFPLSGATSLHLKKGQVIHIDSYHS